MDRVVLGAGSAVNANFEQQYPIAYSLKGRWRDNNSKCLYKKYENESCLNLDMATPKYIFSLAFVLHSALVELYFFRVLAKKFKINIYYS